jgi:protein-arginine kinase
MAETTAIQQAIADTPDRVQDVRDLLAQPTDSEAVKQAEADIDSLIEAAPQFVQESKAGYKTTEFWLTIVGAVLTQVGALHLPGKYGATIATIALLVSYAISRGIAKAGVPNVPGE